MHMKIAGWEAPIYNISGLAFGKEEVRRRVLDSGQDIKLFNERAMRVAFAARWDQEKQPDFYMDLIDKWNDLYPDSDVEFCVFSGSTLRSNNSSYMERTNKMRDEGTLKVYENLDKTNYYLMLNDTRVLFNCALQDWVSNTVSEADALRCNVLYPAYRSFPETFSNDPERLYIPWSLDDAIAKLHKLLTVQHPNIDKISTHTDGTIDRICNILEGRGQHLLRMDTDYRKHTKERKY